MAKTNSLGVRVQPEVKEALEKAAADDLRSMSSLVEKITVEWLRNQGYLPKTPAVRPGGTEGGTE